MRDGDYLTSQYAQTAADVRNGVCPLCEEELRPEDWADRNVPYHVECLAEGLTR